MARSKRLKQTKHKRQTKHRRHRQYGGVSMTYRDYRKAFGFNSKNLGIPGYEDILSMIDLYKNRVSLKQSLDDGIRDKVSKIKYIEYTECKSPESLTSLDSIIVLKKSGVINFSTGIGCTDNIYIELASHNFRIFIQEILNWNPFLNIPYYELELASDAHRYIGTYNGLQVFRQQEWWDGQSWWTSYSQTPGFIEAAARTVAPAAEAEAAELKKKLVENITREIATLNIQLRDIQIKIQVKTVILREAEQQLRQQEQ
jgi:hypothetical protein